MTREQMAWALCLWREARGEGVEGMRAVAWVIWNRSRVWCRSIMSVVMGPNQFTSMTHSKKDGNGVWMFEFPPASDAQWAEAQQIVAAIATGTDTDDPTKGAVYYANLKTADSAWFTRTIVNDAVSHPQTAVIGHHTFFA